MASEKAIKALNKAKISMMSDKGSVFLTTVIFSLRFRWAEAQDNCPTAWVDGVTMCINEDYYLGLNEKQRKSLLAHEAWHVAFMHITRRGDARKPKRWNYAGDYVINSVLKDAGFELGDKWLYKSKYAGMSTVEVYDALEDDKDANDESTPGPGDIKEPSKGDASTVDITELESNITDIIMKATNQARIQGAAGSIPSEIAIGLEQLLHPKLPWEVLFQNYMTAFDKTDFSFRKPNRRFFPEYYLPSLWGESMKHFATAMDSSGSVSDAEFVAQLSEIDSANERMKPESCTLMNFDTEVKNVYEINTETRILDLTFKGRGGTRLQPVFDYYKDIKPTVLVVFSDLHCRAIEEDPGFPVIWICLNNPNATVNFGTLIHYETPR